MKQGFVERDILHRSLMQLLKTSLELWAIKTLQCHLRMQSLICMGTLKYCHQILGFSIQYLLDYIKYHQWRVYLYQTLKISTLNLGSLAAQSHRLNQDSSYGMMVVELV